MSDEKEITALEPSKFVVSEELQKAIEAVTDKIEDRSFSGRNPHLGKMVNCLFCGIRHRANEKKCEQVFTYRIGDYELWREDEEGNKTPDYRTAIRPDEPPTRKQVIGAAAFAKKRFNPHPSRRTLQFIRLVRKLVPSEYTSEELEAARKSARKLLGLDKTFKDKLPRRKDWTSK